jgi:hypothetical protein
MASTPTGSAGEPRHLQQVGYQLLSALQPRQRLPGRDRDRRQRTEGRHVEGIIGLIKVDHTAGAADRVAEPRIQALPPGSLLTEIDADQHHRAAAPQPVIDMVSLAPEPEPGLALTRKAHYGALDLRSDREPADLRISGHELDMAIDAEIPPGIVPHMSGVGHGLIYERLGAETRALLRASLGHDHALPRASCAATPAMAAFTSWSSARPCWATP